MPFIFDAAISECHLYSPRPERPKRNLSALRRADLDLSRYCADSRAKLHGDRASVTKSSRSSGALVEQRRYGAMTARALNEVDRHIAETRAHIKQEKAIIHRLQEGDHPPEDLTRSRDLLKTFEDSLTLLLERRLTILRGLRRQRALSMPSRSSKREWSRRDAG